MDKGEHACHWLKAAQKFIQELRNEKGPQAGADPPGVTIDHKIVIAISDSDEIWITKEPPE